MMMSEKKSKSTKKKVEKKEKSEKKSAQNEELEGGSGQGVRIRPKRKNRIRPSSKSTKSRKDDVPACKTVEKCSVSSNKTSETSQSEWLNDIVGPPSRWNSFCSFVSEYKVPIVASVLLAGTLLYFSVKKTATRCPFTGKTTA